MIRKKILNPFISLNNLLLSNDSRICQARFINNKIEFKILNNRSGYPKENDEYHYKYSDEPFLYIKVIEFFYTNDSKTYSTYISDSEFFNKENKIFFNHLTRLILRILYMARVDKYILA